MISIKKDKGYELIVFDMDGVLVDVNSSWEWVHDHFGVNNKKSLKEYLEGNIDDLEFIRRDVALWKGINPDLTKEDIIEVVTKAPLMDGYKQCMIELEKRGFKKAIISGGLKPLALDIAKNHFDWIYANDVEQKDNRLTGEGILDVPLNDKGSIMDELIKQSQIDPNKTVSVGNGFIDIPMFEKSGLSIAFNPEDDRVKDAADIVIDESDLTLLLDHI